MFKTLLVTCILVLTLIAGPVAAGGLWMFESPNCEWCEAWDRDVGTIYDKTKQGKKFPLHRIRLGTRIPKTIAITRPIVYTPTFILVENGQEIGRITGYPGEDFFWGLLDELLDTVSPSGKPPPS